MKKSMLMLLALTLLFGPMPAASSQAAVSPDDKLAPWVAERLAETGEADVLIILAEQADLSAARAFRSKDERGRFVSQRLRETAERTQLGVLVDLALSERPARPFWIANMIQARVDAATAAILAARPDVERIVGNPAIQADLPEPERLGVCPPTLEASLLQVDADVFWNAGFDGEGVVIAGQDTGYDWDHPALRDAYRGWDGANASHDYNWHDSIHSGGGACGADAAAPCDDHNHGTHTMGTMIGETSDGAVRIGVAAGARWIGCRNMDQGNGTPATYAECFEWFVAPTRVDGSDPDPSQAPDIINNSWGCPPSEGCDADSLRTVVENARAAGILVVASAGNSGSSCSSVDDPAAIYDASFTVGSVDAGDNIAGSSSRGPVTVDGSNRMKPDISAPGVGICSSVRGTGYSTFSGTSMAGPHVAGMAALTLSAAPCWRGDVDALEAHLIGNALARTTGQDCGGVDGSQVPNNTYGHGSMRGVLPTACLPPFFFDGFESGDLSAWTM